MPVRIQRKRTKGWKMPANTISVTSPGEYGNPFAVGEFVRLGKGGNGYAFMKCLDEKYAGPGYVKVESNAQAVSLYREYLTRYPLAQSRIDYLKGKNLACWCKIGEPCHADVLLEIVNK